MLFGGEMGTRMARTEKGGLAKGGGDIAANRRRVGE